ncbi:MAG: Hsp33 family molecular chaperone [Proteobacteria bacterium]|nr:Hsp33 family molecular chaperone [Pseudomonadota bacterium]
MVDAGSVGRRADDVVQPFQIDAPGLRGRLVRLGASVDQVLSRHDYPEPVARLLGETLALAAALSGALKYDGVFSLQTKGDGPIRMMVADITTEGAMRGYAAFDEQALADALASAAGAPLSAPVPRLLGRGHLAFTVDQGPDTERYQGIVELSGGTLADCVHHYFRQSEQLQAGIRLACGRAAASDGSVRWRAGALMLQRLPGRASPDALDDDSADDDWRRSLLMMGSSTPAELIDPELTPDQLLFRLFHEDGVRVYAPHNVRAGCRCSRERVARMLRALPRDEIAELKIDDAVIVTCEFCNSGYTFTDPQLAEIYDA